MRRWIVLLSASLVALTLTAADHTGNLLYHQLRSGATPLPAPYMADGLTAEQQRSVIDKLPGRNQEVDEMLRLSPVAPLAVKFNELSSKNSSEPIRSIDLAFVTPGSLEKLARTDVLDRLLNSGRNDASIKPLTNAPQAVKDAHEAQAHVSLPIMDRVLLEGTIHTMWTKNVQSLVLAGRLDPRFTNDAQYPNRWQTLQRDGEGKVKPTGVPKPYEAAAFYFKFTPLTGVPDALFVEWHLVFAEPAGWFDGANLLRSKLPIVLQTKIRAFRRDMMR